MKFAIAVFAPLVLAGCLTHMPCDPDPQHVKICWAADFSEAKRAAGESGRPLLVCLIAGEICDHC